MAFFWRSFGANSSQAVGSPFAYPAPAARIPHFACFAPIVMWVWPPISARGTLTYPRTGNSPKRACLAQACRMDCERPGGRGLYRPRSCVGAEQKLNGRVSDLARETCGTALLTTDTFLAERIRGGATLASQAGYGWTTAPDWNRGFYISWL
jgi:hypothetical protein